MGIFGRIGTAAVAALMLAGCGGAGDGKRQVLNVVSGRLAVAATPDRPSAGYVTILGGPAPVDLVAVTTRYAGRAEIHETVKENGIVSMREVRRVPVPVQGRVAFQPGGKHIMLWDVEPAALKTGAVPMTFIFSNNQRIAADLKVEAAGKAGDHAGH